MNKKKASGLLVGLLLIALQLAACSSTTRIQGKVTLSADKKAPFAGVTVSLKDATLDAKDPKALVAETTTDQQGNYSFSDVKPGTYTLSMGANVYSLPSGITHCTFPAFDVKDGWLIISGTTSAGGGATIAVLQEKFSISTGDVVRYNLDFECE